MTHNLNEPADKPESNADKMAVAASAAVEDLVRQHWTEIELAREESGKSKINVGVSLKFTRMAEESYKLETKINFSRKHSDEREDYIHADDPKQHKLGLADLKKDQS